MFYTESPGRVGFPTFRQRKNLQAILDTLRKQGVIFELRPDGFYTIDEQNAITETIGIGIEVIKDNLLYQLRYERGICVVCGKKYKAKNSESCKCSGCIQLAAEKMYRSMRKVRGKGKPQPVVKKRVLNTEEPFNLFNFDDKNIDGGFDMFFGEEDEEAEHEKDSSNQQITGPDGMED